MPGPTVDEAKVHRIQQMRRSGYTLPEIAVAEKVSTSTVRRYTDPNYRAQTNAASTRVHYFGRLSHDERIRRHNANRKPLYDPKDHELEFQSVTAEQMGDPRPGRREIEAPPDEPRVRRQPWRPGSESK